jgi:predicted phosphohydrolase
MNKKIVAELRRSIKENRKDDFEKQFKILLTEVAEDKAAEILSEIISKQYTRMNADYLAIFLEIALKQDFNIAIESHPTNQIFALVIIKGSIDLWDCYKEVGIEPHLTNLTAADQQIFYKELLKIAANLNESIIGDYNELVKGRHYNGAFGEDQTYENAVLINIEDYRRMEEVVEAFNSIIGRRNILKDLMKKSGMAGN